MNENKKLEKLRDLTQDISIIHNNKLGNITYNQDDGDTFAGSIVEAKDNNEKAIVLLYRRSGSDTWHVRAISEADGSRDTGTKQFTDFNVAAAAWKKLILKLLEKL